MNNLRKLLFLLLLMLYGAGILVGGMREVRASNQAELYQYLDEGVRGYDTESAKGVKYAITENMGIFALLVVGGLIKPLLWLPAAALIIKGYLVGFSITAALRLYGISGYILCAANLASAAILIPAAAYYGSINSGGLIERENRKTYYKRFFAVTFFLGTIFCADALIKGAVSPIFVKWASGHILLD